MPFLVSVFFGFVPMFLFAYIIYWLDRYEKEPKALLGAAFLWGAVIAAGGAFIINTVLGIGVFLFTGSEAATDLVTGSIIAPLVEESLKGLAVLCVFLFFRREFDSILDGIVYGAVAALGFAAVENTHYIYNYGWLDGGWEGLWYLVFVRVILVGWQHPFYTAFTGIGLAGARLTRNGLLKFIYVVLGFGAAVFTHSLHNTLASLLSGFEGLLFGSFLDWTGWFFMFLFIVWMIARERKLLRTYLYEEIARGSLTARQYQTAISAWSQSFARLGALFSGRFRDTRRFYQICGELAHKKHQLHTMGDEGGNNAIVETLRAELARLSPRAGT